MAVILALDPWGEVENQQADQSRGSEPRTERPVGFCSCPAYRIPSTGRLPYNTNAVDEGRPSSSRTRTSDARAPHKVWSVSPRVSSDPLVKHESSHDHRADKDAPSPVRPTYAGSHGYPVTRCADPTLSADQALARQRENRAPLLVTSAPKSFPARKFAGRERGTSYPLRVPLPGIGPQTRHPGNEVDRTAAAVTSAHFSPFLFELKEVNYASAAFLAANSTPLLMLPVSSALRSSTPFFSKSESSPRPYTSATPLGPSRTLLAK